MPHHSTVPKGLRIAQICCAIFWCLLAAGPIFGFAALKPVLLAEGVYQELCTPEEIEDKVPICTLQELRLNLMFTIAAVSTNITALAVGSTLDTFGPRVCGLIGSVFLAVAMLILRSASSFVLFDGYIVGYSLLALGGPFTFISSFQLSNSFPANSGTILALLTGAFDSSSAVFLIYRLLYEHSGNTFSLHKFFTIYLVVPIFIALAQIFLMPHESYSTIADLTKIAEEGSDVYEDEENTKEQTTVKPDDESTALLSSSPTEVDYTTTNDELERPNPSIASTIAADPESGLENDKDPMAVSGVYGVLHGKSALQQLKTPWFFLIACFTIIQMLRLNYFVATLLSQYTYLFHSYSKAKALNNYFDVALPLGGVIAVPFIGALLDNFSTLAVLSVLVTLSLVIGVLGFLPFALPAYINVSLFVVYRPFYYTSVSDYSAKVFGFDTFGKVYGLIICLSGSFNLLQANLDVATHTHFNGNPTPLNMLLVSITAVVGFSITSFIAVQTKNIRRKQLEDEAERAPVLAMPASNSCANGCDDCVCNI